MRHFVQPQDAFPANLSCGTIPITQKSTGKVEARVDSIQFLLIGNAEQLKFNTNQQVSEQSISNLIIFEKLYLSQFHICITICTRFFIIAE